MGSRVEGIELFSNSKRIKSLLFVSLLLSSIFCNYFQPSFALITDATGGTITYSGSYKIHTFTTSGTFTVVSGSGDVDYLVVAGGGGGGGCTLSNSGAGGGGAGGMKTGTLAVTTTSYSITVGAGGSGGSTSSNGGAGTNSVFNSTTSTGGGGGAKGQSGASAGNGGSGGGGSNYDYTGGTGNGGEGFAGGTSNAGADAAGGGGASEVGFNSDAGGTYAGDGGDGLASSISGASVTYAGGGGGGTWNGGTAGLGGAGGGGNAGASTGGNGVAGTANRGGGGGGCSINTGQSGTGGAGGSGIVIIRYLTSVPPTTPTNLSTTATNSTNINLNWDDAPSYDNILGYRIFTESPTGNGFSLLVNDTGTSTSSYSHSGLTTKTQHNYKVAGINGTGVSSNSTASATYTWGVPDAVTAFTVTGVSTTSLYLDWTAPVIYGYAVTGYKIERESPIGGGFSTLVADTGNTNTDYTDTGLSLLTQYNYRVTPLSAFGNGISNTASGTTPSSPPISFTMNDCNHTCSTQLNLEWVAPSGTILGYKGLCETPVGAGFTTLINDTASTNQYYNATGLVSGSVYNCKVAAWTAGGLSAYSNTYAYSPHHLPDIVDDLIALATSFSSVDLSWSAPVSYAPEILGYMINYTTPYGDPQTILSANTGTTATEYEVTGIYVGSDVSFRVSAITVHGLNASGNIANATVFSEYTIGALTLPEDSGDPTPIRFHRTDLNSTSLELEVIYSDTMTPSCDFEYTLLNSNQTYSGLVGVPFDASHDVYVFTIYNANEDVIFVDCWNPVNLDEDGQFLIIQEFYFPFIEVLDNFRNGTWGTEGQLGAVDLITFLVIVVSMIGFNRVNAAAGVITCVIIIGVCGALGIIEPVSIVFGVLALVTMVAIGVQTKHD